MCLKHQRNHPHKKEQALLRDLVGDEFDFPVNLGNRALHKALPEPYDDKPVAALAETKPKWMRDAPMMHWSYADYPAPLIE